MSTKTKIEWTEATWNPVRGCSRVSEGCRHCYAEKIAGRFCKPGEPYAGLVRIVEHTRPGAAVGEKDKREALWTGKISFIKNALRDPLGWKKPRRVFVNSMSDLFHENVKEEWIEEIFAIMAVRPRHTFQFLTKRPGRMQEFLSTPGRDSVIWHLASKYDITMGHSWPLPNVWAGVSVEDQPSADARIPELLRTPAAVRFISAEPLLDQVKLKWEWVSHGRPIDGGPQVNMLEPWKEAQPTPALDWVIVGGESGPESRPMHPDWARLLRDQCAAAGVKYFFKQWGNWGPHTHPGDFIDKARGAVNWKEWPDGTWMHEWGKKYAGRLLDGREWNEYPQ